MAIVSDAHTLNGRPRLAGRRIWVAHVVAHVNEEGLEYCNDFGVREEEVREALAYCMRQECDDAISYCNGCRKSELCGKNFWEDARALYERFFTK